MLERDEIKFGDLHHAAGKNGSHGKHSPTLDNIELEGGNNNASTPKRGLTSSSGKVENVGVGRTPLQGADDTD